jgi:hypothetical protein
VPAAKLQNADEFTRWWNDGKSYEWIIDQYEQKYNLRITTSAIGNWRHRLALPRRHERNVTLVPWTVKPEHRYRHALAMLRAEARSRLGEPLSDIQALRLARWREFMADENCVVHYDPDTEDGFFYVARRDGVDTDYIREPDQSTRTRGKRE